jgi:argonaute-like protein implicated in RNA metabolism and viral defense
VIKEKIMKKTFNSESIRIIDNPFDTKNYGVYKFGMTSEEIKKYLKAINIKYKIKNTYKKFCKIAGINTMALIKSPCCNKEISLMYYHDVERFARALFVGTPTYFD